MLVLAQMLLVLASWLLAATNTEGVRSLLSSEGVRWFFSNFTAMVASPWLVWLLLAAMAGGCVWQSGLLSRGQGFRDRLALRTTVVLLIIYIGVVLLLTAVPHAVLLSATGQLFPSAFSRALVPLIAFGAIFASVVYGWVSGRFTRLSGIIDAFAFGISQSAPIFVLYVVAIQLYESIIFVFLSY
jgi:aminobenzoyl-glutamate transport protein